jgi:hypothetical protein
MWGAATRCAAIRVEGPRLKFALAAFLVRVKGRLGDLVDLLLVVEIGHFVLHSS